MKRILIIAILTAALCGQVQAQNLIGALSGTLGPGTYYVIGEISVQNGSSLVLLPGTTFYLNGNYSFAIYGNLQAIGTAADSIRFMKNTGVVEWSGFNFMNPTSSTSRLEYCVVTGSTCNGIEMIGSSPTISHCRISGNAAGAG